MKRILVLACALAVSTGALAQLYKWVDKDGRTHYSDQPPSTQPSKQLSVPTGPTTAPQRSAIEKDKELDKNRLDAKEKAKATEVAEKKAQVEQENCDRAKANLRAVTSGARIRTYDAKGEASLMDDEQLAAERIKAQKAVDEACKSS